MHPTKQLTSRSTPRRSRWQRRSQRLPTKHLVRGVSPPACASLRPARLRARTHVRRSRGTRRACGRGRGAQMLPHPCARHEPPRTRSRGSTTRPRRGTNHRCSSLAPRRRSTPLRVAGSSAAARAAQRSPCAPPQRNRAGTEVPGPQRVTRTTRATAGRAVWNRFR